VRKKIIASEDSAHTLKGTRVYLGEQWVHIKAPRLWDMAQALT